jgi:AraC-like DNA-binding protein
MVESGTQTYGDPDGYAGAFGDARVDLTITGAGDFMARLTRLRLKHMEIFRCHETLPRIAFISLPGDRIFLSFAIGADAPVFGRYVLRSGDMILHGRGESIHQRSTGACQWGLISLAAGPLASYGKALTGHPLASPCASRILRPARTDASRFRRLFRQACRLAEAGKKLIERPEVARALEQEMLHAVIHCLAADEADDIVKARRHHAAVMVRFEEVLSRLLDRKLSMPVLCTEVGVAERTLRMCCAEFLGVCPTRYVTLKRLNKARAALRRADPSMSSVAEVARNHQFLELGRFSVTYRATFGESPSVTLQREPQT